MRSRDIVVNGAHEVLLYRDRNELRQPCTLVEKVNGKKEDRMFGPNLLHFSTLTAYLSVRQDLV